MLFNSAEYLLLFLPIVLLVFIWLARAGNTEAQISWLIVASIFFYASWNPVYMVLIISSLLVNFAVGRQLANTEPDRRRGWLIAGLSFNLGLLAYCKYAGFFIDNLNAIGRWLIPMPEIVLPLAISFFTFQQIAYLVDVARDECSEYRLRHYALFVLFFPQLIAGPIVHHREMMPQFEKLRLNRYLSKDLAVGLTIIAIGLFKKVVLADSLAGYADPLFAAADAGTPLSPIDSWIATFSFSFQIYFDFSGYSDMAIGSARLFGIRLPENFRSPYKASNIIEFWRHWHMTLSRFLRDYLYITLGGNRRGGGRRYTNLVATMLLGGLWHGAAWTYVVWGGLHGVFLCINHAWRKLCRDFQLEWLQSTPWLRPVYVLITFLAVSLAFTIFRASDLDSALAILQAGFGATFASTFTPTTDHPAALLKYAIIGSSLGEIFTSLGAAKGSYLSVYCLLAVSAGVCWLLPNTQRYMQDFGPVPGTGYGSTRAGFDLRRQPGWASSWLIALLLSLGLLSLSAVSEFIYFQF